MASSTQNVVRYTALLTGIFYGLVHTSTLQAKHDEEQAHKKAARRETLIAQARKAYAEKLVADKAGKTSSLITDPEDPKFDLEKLIDSWSAKA